MKIQCDVCTKKEALVFCSADEAALCHGCDQGVHHANKLASKHQRFSLLHPPPSLAPLCDICQEKRALVFCQEDRAILCRDCEVPLHTTNEHTRKHNRFLLTGIKISAECDLGISGCDPVPEFESPRIRTSQISSSEPGFTNSGSNVMVNSVNDQFVSGGSSTSSTSEYLIERLPGWHFEDFVDASFGLKVGNLNHEFEVDEDVLSFWDVDIDKNKMNSFPNSTYSTQSENLGTWAPQAPIAAAVTTSVFGIAQPPTNLLNTSGLIQVGMKHQETNVNGFKIERKWRRDDVFTVPQLIHSLGSKRPRPFW